MKSLIFSVLLSIMPAFSVASNKLEVVDSLSVKDSLSYFTSDSNYNARIQVNNATD